MVGVEDVLQWTTSAAWLFVGVWAVLRWRRYGTEASAWLAATFGTLAGAVGLGLVGTELLGGGVLPEWLQRVVVALIVPFPYFLLRFLHAFEPVRQWMLRVTGAVTIALVVAGVVFDLPDEGEAQTTFAAVYTLVVVLQWVAVLPLVARRFWKAGAHQPTPARRRVRLLAAGVVALTVAIVIAGAAPEPGTTLFLVSQLVGLVTVACFVIGLAPPRPLRTLWRQPEEERIGELQERLLEVETPHEVAAAVAPVMRHVVAARRVEIDKDGAPLWAESTDDEAAGQPIELPLRRGTARVWPGRYAPFFGPDEVEALERLGRLADLALARTELLERERAVSAELESTNGELEATNAELEAFVYSASHDLKSPVIAILSYVSIFEEEYGDQLDDEARYFLTRMRSNGQFMEALVRDLLELSRVGRRDTSPARVDLDELARAVAADVGADRLTVLPRDLPDLWLNPLRTRQVVENLLRNAVNHGTGDHTTVEVWCEPDGDAALVHVRDDGPGIPTEYHERVFGVFEQLAPRDNGGANGTGMGLAIVRKFLESVGGSIHLTPDETGAHFVLRFPAATLAAPEHDRPLRQDAPA